MTVLRGGQSPLRETSRTAGFHALTFSVRSRGRARKREFRTSSGNDSRRFQSRAQGSRGVRHFARYAQSGGLDRGDLQRIDSFVGLSSDRDGDPRGITRCAYVFSRASWRRRKRCSAIRRNSEPRPLSHWPSGAARGTRRYGVNEVDYAQASPSPSSAVLQPAISADRHSWTISSAST